MSEEKFWLLRELMVKEQLISRGINDKRIVEAFLKVPRHEFVPPSLKEEAYNDYPLPIGFGQTISQPYMVAIMLETARLKPQQRVLEIGTGSGYQTALLLQLVKEVYSIERVPELAGRAKEILERLGYSEVKIKIGDGSVGWEEFAPFDRIIVTAAAPEIPVSLKRQLSPNGGNLIVPVGQRYHQILKIVSREGKNYNIKEGDPCVFVPLVGKEGWEE